MPIPSSGVLRAAGSALTLLALACGNDTPKVSVTTTSTAAPHPIAFDPPNGATGVDPARTMLSVTFDREMDPQGWAWVIEGTMTAPELGESAWDPALRVNTVQAKLEPGRDYVLWVNSPQYLYFKDRQGTPATPTRWTFSTRGGEGSQPAPGSVVGMLRTRRGGAPRVVRLDPPNGATDVDPGLSALQATFDREMEPSWSWVTEGQDFPETTGEAHFEPDRRTATLPVRLEPGRTYVVWLNSVDYDYFRDEDGTPATPLRWTFTTRLAKP